MRGKLFDARLDAGILSATGKNHRNAQEAPVDADGYASRAAATPSGYRYALMRGRIGADSGRAGSAAVGGAPDIDPRFAVRVVDNRPISRFCPSNRGKSGVSRAMPLGIKLKLQRLGLQMEAPPVIPQNRGRIFA